MHTLLLSLTADLTFTGDTRRDMAAFLTRHNCPHTAGHCASVAAEAKRLAQRFGVEPARAELGGLLHDISAVIPNVKRIDVARQLNVPVLPEEVAFPMIIHQKLSVVVAREIFGVTDEGVLSAIGCHTTLKAEATVLDKVVFLADKIAWDQPGQPPYLAAMLRAVDQSLDEGVWVYLDYLWQQRATLKVVHPWFEATYHEYEQQRNQGA